LKEKLLEAVMSFEAEIGWEKEEEHRREILEKHRYSPYIEEVEGWPESEGRDKYLTDLKRLRHLMVLFRLGHGGTGMGYAFVNLKNKYPETHAAFTQELFE
jgi:hypothetical protein